MGIGICSQGPEGRIMGTSATHRLRALCWRDDPMAPFSPPHPALNRCGGEDVFAPGRERFGAGSAIKHVEGSPSVMPTGNPMRPGISASQATAGGAAQTGGGAAGPGDTAALQQGLGVA